MERTRESDETSAAVLANTSKECSLKGTVWPEKKFKRSLKPTANDSSGDIFESRLKTNKHFNSWPPEVLSELAQVWKFFPIVKLQNSYVDVKSVTKASVGTQVGSKIITFKF